MSSKPFDLRDLMQLEEERIRRKDLGLPPMELEPVDLSEEETLSAEEAAELVEYFHLHRRS